VLVIVALHCFKVTLLEHIFEIINQKIIVAAGQLELTGGAQPIFVFFPKSTKNKYTTTFGSPTAQKICSNYSIRRWSFLFITKLVFIFKNTTKYLLSYFKRRRRR
jgi:hypothetical protein